MEKKTLRLFIYFCYRNIPVTLKKILLELEVNAKYFAFCSCKRVRIILIDAILLLQLTAPSLTEH